MKKILSLLFLAALAFSFPACEQSYTEKAVEADSGHRDADVDETGQSVNDQRDGGMGDHENQTEGTAGER